MTISTRKFSMIAGTNAPNASLGRGACGAVDLVGKAGSGQAVRKTAKPSTGAYWQRLMRREVEIHLRAHLLWVSCIPSVVESTQSSITMEYLVGATLRDFLEAASTFILSPEEIDDVIDAVAEALRLFRSVGLIHGDLHTDNVFITREDGKIKAYVIDLGYSVFEDDDVDEYEEITGWDFPDPERDFETLINFIEDDYGILPEEWAEKLYYAICC